MGGCCFIGMASPDATPSGILVTIRAMLEIQSSTKKAARLKRRIQRRSYGFLLPPFRIDESRNGADDALGTDQCSRLGPLQMKGGTH